MSLRRALALTAATVALVAGTAVPAAALDIDLGCPPGVTESKVAPVPEMPGRGVSDMLPTPDAPPTGDPFADGSDTSIYEAYGLAGLGWDTYDLGCGGSLADPDAAADTAIANGLMVVPTGLTAITGALAGVVYEPTWLAVFDRPLVELSAGLREAFYTPLAPFALFAAGIVIIWASRRAAFGAAAATALVVLAAIGVVAVATAVPTQLGAAADTAITSTSGQINARLSGREDAAADPEVEAVAPFVDEVLYPRWLAGTLGSSDSTTATTYGPDLFRASAYTWAEAAQIEADPAASERLLEEKQQLWEDTAAAVADADPDAYSYLTGARATRSSEAVAAVLSVLVLLFPIGAFVLMLASFVLIRLVVMTAPVWATFALMPSGHGIIRAAGGVLLAAVINPVLAAVGATLTLRTIALLLAPDSAVPLWLGLVLAMIVCAIAWVALKPFRRIATLFTGSPLTNATGQIRSDAAKAKNLTGKSLTFLAKAKVGAAVTADEIGDEIDERDEDARDRAASLRARAQFVAGGAAGEGFTRTALQTNLDTPLTAPAAPPTTPRHAAAWPSAGPLPQAERTDAPTVEKAQSDVDDMGFPAHKPDPVVTVSRETPPPAAHGAPSEPYWQDAVTVDEGSRTTPERVRDVAGTVDVEGTEAYVLYDYVNDTLVAEPLRPAADDA